MSLSVPDPGLADVPPPAATTSAATEAPDANADRVIAEGGPTGTCSECGRRYYGWALTAPGPHRCDCGGALKVRMA